MTEASNLYTSRIGLSGLEKELRRLDLGLSQLVNTEHSRKDPTTTRSYSDFRPVCMVSLNIDQSKDPAVIGVTWCEIHGDTASFHSEQWRQVQPGIFVVTSQKV